MKTKKIILLIIIYSLFTASCNKKIQLFKDIKISRNSKLYFYNVPEDNSKKENQFKQKYKNFYIDNRVVLKQIKNEWVLKKAKNYAQLNSFYRISWLEENKILGGGLLVLNGNEIFTASYPLEFEIEMLEKYSYSFKHLEAYKLKCNNIINARLLYEALNNKSYFTSIFLNDNNKNPLYLYDGFTALLLPYKKGSGIKKTEKLVRNDFKKIGNTKIIRFHASLKKDSVEIDVYSKTDISTLIPKKYTIAKNFTILKDINFSVFGINKKELDEIITNLKLVNKIKIEKFE